jgi:predicted aspartyl protease
MGTSRLAKVFGCALAIGAAALAAQPALAECKIAQIAEFAVDSRGNQPVIDGQINGQPIKVLIDTGAVVTLIWRDAAGRLGLPLTNASQADFYGVGGATQARTVEVNDLRLGRFDHGRIRLWVAGERPLDRRDVALVLGQDFLSQVDVEFDLPDNVIRLLQPKDCQIGQLPYWAKSYSQADLQSLDLNDLHLTTVVKLNGKPLLATLDTGAPTSVVTLEAAATAGLTPASAGVTPMETQGGVGANRVASWIGVFESLVLGDETIRNPKLRIADLFRYSKTGEGASRIPVQIMGSSTMLIGADFFRSHRVLVSPSRHVMVFTYSGGPVFQAIGPEGGSAAK